MSCAHKLTGGKEVQEGFGKSPGRHTVILKEPFSRQGLGKPQSILQWTQQIGRWDAKSGAQKH